MKDGGVYFYNSLREELYRLQELVAQKSRYITIFTEQSKNLWKKEFGQEHKILLIPTGVDKVVPSPGNNPYQEFKEKIAVYIGNLYAGSAIAGLCAVLDVAKPGQRIMMVAYGSGAGSDAFVWSVTEEIEGKRERVIPINNQISHPKREYMSYDFYRRCKDNH